MSTFFLFFIIAFGGFIMFLAYKVNSMSFMLLGLFLIILFSFFAGANILKLMRGYPYIKITDEYIQLDSNTKSEVTIYFEEINFIKVTEMSFQSHIEIVLHHEDEYFSQLSFHNKVRLFMNRVFSFSLFTISLKAIPKQERPALMEELDIIMQQKFNANTGNIVSKSSYHTESDFMERYDPTPPIDRSINFAYFKKAYLYSFFIFALSFIIFYFLISKNIDYLLYIIVSFILYPFARVLIDWLFGFKLRHVIDKQKGVIYPFVQFQFLIDLCLFHVSFLIAPIGIAFLLIRYIVIRVKQS